MSTDKPLLQQLNKLHGSKTVIVGIGNTLKGDDAVGPLICRNLAGKIAAELIDVGTVPENYIQPIVKKTPQNLIIIDAIDFGASPGAIDIFKPEQLSSFTFSTHTLSPRLFIDMIAQQIQVEVFVIGIQPAQTQMGQSMSVQVSEAAQQLSQTLAEVFPLKK